MRHLSLGVAAAVSALLGWLTLLVVARVGGAEQYAALAVVWSVYYAGLGLLAGIQQNVTISALDPPVPAGCPASWPILLLGGPVCVTLGLVASATDDGASSGVAVGLLIAVAVTGGTGLVLSLGVRAAEGDTSGQAFLLLVDSVGRLGLVAAAATLSRSEEILVVALAASAWTWSPWGARAAGRALALEVEPRAFLRRALPLVLTAGCTSLLVAGMPILLVVVGDRGAATPGVLAALVFLRSPVLAIVLAYRATLLAAWVRAGSAVTHRAVVLMGSLLSGGVFAAAWWMGPWGLALVVGEDFDLRSSTAAAVAASAVVMGVCVVMTMGRAAEGDAGTAAGAWSAALLATCAVLALAPPGEGGVALASLAGPLVATVMLSVRRSGRRQETRLIHG